MKKTLLTKAFTLIEILIAVSVLAILSGVTLSVINSGSIQGKGRDAQRKADLQKIRTALELYYSDNKTYPVSANATVVSTSLSTLTSGGYISTLPTDPSQTGTTFCSEDTKNYFYKSNGNTYSLYAHVEAESSVGNFTCTQGADSCGASFCYKQINP